MRSDLAGLARPAPRCRSSGSAGRGRTRAVSAARGSPRRAAAPRRRRRANSRRGGDRERRRGPPRPAAPTAHSSVRCTARPERGGTGLLGDDGRRRGRSRGRPSRGRTPRRQAGAARPAAAARASRVRPSSRASGNGSSSGTACSSRCHQVVPVPAAYGLGRAERQPPPRARHRDVQHVQRLRAAAPPPRARTAPAATAGSAPRCRRRRSAAVPAPRPASRPAASRARCRGFSGSASSSSTVSASRPLAPCTVSRRTAPVGTGRAAFTRALAQRAHEGIRRRVAAAVEEQRLGEHRVDGVEAGLPLAGRQQAAACGRADRPRGRCGRAGRAAAARRRPRPSRAAARAARASAGDGSASDCSASHQPRRLAVGRREGDQVGVAGAHERALQHARERKAVLRRGQQVEQRDQVLRAGRIHQRRLGDRPVRHGARPQGVGGEVQRFALAGQQHRLGGRRVAGSEPLAQQVGGARRLLLAQHLVGHEARRRQRVAPGLRRIGALAFAVLLGPRDAWQPPDAVAGPLRLRRGVRAEALELAIVGGRLEDPVDRLDHRAARCARCGRRRGDGRRTRRRRIRPPPRTRAARRRESDRGSASGRRR